MSTDGAEDGLVIDKWGVRIPAEDVTALVRKDGQFPVAGGGFGDVYKGKLNAKSHIHAGRSYFLTAVTKAVAIKVFRPLSEGSDLEIVARRLGREIGLWQRLHHENIVSFLGVSTAFGPLPAIISLWQEHGTVKSYLQQHPDANRWELLRGVARALTFLHEHDPQITHGDIKADNVLVNDWGGPCLSDFGISAVHSENTIWQTQTKSVDGTTRYMSPELLNETQKRITSESDTYAYAMTSLEIMTNRTPFSKYESHVAALTAVVMRDERPERPLQDDIPDELWNLWEFCWQTDPDFRPEMRDVEKVMTNMCASERPLRLLSVDGGGIRVVCSLISLKALMSNIGPNAKPCEYFDMIAGSGAGGVAAILLGRLRLSIDDCIHELRKAFESLLGRPVEKQMKKLAKGKCRFDHNYFQDYFHPIINAKVNSDARGMADRGRRACKTFVIATDMDEPTTPLRLRSYPTRTHEPFAHRIWVAMGATYCTPTVFEHVWGENTSLDHYNNPDISRTNPSSDLFDEAREVFGEHRRIACLVSCGNGISTRNFAPDSNLTDGLPSNLVGTLHETALEIETIDVIMESQCPAGTYFRFDPVETVIRTVTPETWRDAVAWEIWERMGDYIEMTQEYVVGEMTSHKLKECAARLKRTPRTPRKGSGIDSSPSIDSLSLISL